MNPEHLSPEERLLQLIRKRRKEGAKQEEMPSAGAPGKRRLRFRFPRLPDLRIRKRTPRPLAADETFSVFQKVNRVLAVGFGGLVCLSVMSLFWNRVPSGSAIRARGAPLEETHTLTGDASPEPYSYYGEVLEKRNLFGPAVPSETEEVFAGPDIPDTLQDLSLLGIVTGTSPQAIIENKKEGKTLFVTPGDRIGILRVEAITEDKVILNYRGERIDLLL